MVTAALPRASTASRRAATMLRLARRLAVPSRVDTRLLLAVLLAKAATLVNSRLTPAALDRLGTRCEDDMVRERGSQLYVYT